jgi:ubiquinone/menaquinone biosynthesis C-methylase UbiE
VSGFQLSGDAPTAYTRFALKIVEPWTDDLILSAGCRDGDRVLDVACGTGVVASRVNLVSRKLCYVTGIDINEGMLNAARINPQVQWHLGSATELPFDAGSFDVVLCQQGLQYFPDRMAAMREMARVLAPGGRVCLNVWGALERQHFS